MRAGIRSAILAGWGVFGAALGWLLSFKILAYGLGPEGVGLFSQFRQIVQTVTLGATYGGTNVIVQGLAPLRNEASRGQFRATASRLIGLTGLGIVLFMLLASPQLTRFALSSDAPELVSAVRWLSLAILFSIVATYMLAVLNGYRAYTYLALAQIVGPALLAVFLLALCKGNRLSGALDMAGALTLCFGASCLVGAWGIFRLPRRVTSTISESLPAGQDREFRRFALFNLVAALSSVVCLLVIRAWIIEAEGLAFAGLFDAGWTLTFNYTSLFLTACNVLYLPSLTAATEMDRQKAQMLKMAYLVFGVSLLICYAMVLWSGPLIHLLYSQQFEASGRGLSILVIAVMFRGISWVYGTMMLATRSGRIQLISELVLNLFLLATTRYALDNNASLESLGWAFVLPHFLYLVFVIEYVRTKNRLMYRRNIWPLLIAGVLPLIYLAIMHSDLRWSNTEQEKWIFMTIGLAVSSVAFRAFRKMTP